MPRASPSRADAAPSAPAGAAPRIPAVAVFFGPSRFLQLDQTARLRAAIAAAEGVPPADVSTALFDGQSAIPADILDECRSLSLMASRKLVIVDNADLLLKAADDDEAAPAPPASRARHAGKSARELFESYAASPEPSATLLLRADTWRGGNLDKAILAGGGAVMKFDEPSAADAAAWAIARAASHHQATLARDAAALLVANIGPELARLDSELAKLALSAGPDRAITTPLVASLVGFSREEDAWNLQGTLLAGDPQAALRALRRALDVSRHSPVFIGITYLDLARKLDGAARGLAARENPRAIAARLRLWGPSTDAILRAAARLHPAHTAALLQAAIDADLRQKSGQGEPEHILEGLTLRFAALQP